MKKTQTFLTSVIITLFAYSIIVFAYMHSEFVGKDVFEMVCSRLERIEHKLDLLIDRRPHE